LIPFASYLLALLQNIRESSQLLQGLDSALAFDCSADLELDLLDESIQYLAVELRIPLDLLLPKSLLAGLFQGIPAFPLVFSLA
jgi:hypothetical protein